MSTKKIIYGIDLGCVGYSDACVAVNQVGPNCEVELLHIHMRKGVITRNSYPDERANEIEKLVTETVAAGFPYPDQIYAEGFHVEDTRGRCNIGNSHDWRHRLAKQPPHMRKQETLSTMCGDGLKRRLKVDAVFFDALVTTPPYQPLHTTSLAYRFRRSKLGAPVPLPPKKLDYAAVINNFNQRIQHL
jgi:hypothetical protein